jgi:DNA-binding transcriptional regulator YiaG
MDRTDYQQHFAMLELPTEAGHADVKRAYLLLKEIYRKDSLALLAVPDDISSAQTEEILLRIEESYRALTEMFAKEQNVVAEFVDRIVVDQMEFSGDVLQKIRRRLGVSLDDMAMATRVSSQHLANIEADNFSALPVAVYTRGFVMHYARFLALDPEMVAKSYMVNFRQYREENGK